MARIHYEIPEELHRRAKAKAAIEGMTLKEFVIRALEEATKDAPTSRTGSKGNDSGK